MLIQIIHQSEIETNWNRREIEKNLQSQSQALDCSLILSVYTNKFLYIATTYATTYILT